MADTDYIIVGAGSAGCVLANRLTDSGKHKVTLIEAGGSDARFYVHLPLGYGKLFYDPAVNWMYKTEPDPGLAGQQDHWPRGKILGGSSSINAMVWIRGHRADYEDWGARESRLGLGRMPGRLPCTRGQRGGRRCLAGQGRGRLFISAKPFGAAPDWCQDPMA